jgi:alkanesulfonate monooxygenase SsuD/methylene tetrahydromethanopterin reductase-like flavin-dependent oxidoreductase (luciferase family)
VTGLGVIFTADRPPEELPAFAAAAETAGLDELWLWEDCFLAGGIAASATALAMTERIAVGIGILPAAFRNPVACAMELATLARLHPGRLVAGLGHGMPTWMDQVGALPEKPVRALEEVTRTVRRLLAGERFSFAGDHVRVRDVGLLQPPGEAPPVVLGVRRPLGLRASGRSADGTILAEPAPPAYITWARDRIEEGRTAAGRTDPHRLIVFLKYRLDPDRGHARAWVAEILREESVAAQLAPLGLGDARRVSEELVDLLTASGSAEQVLATLASVAAAGVDSIALTPIGPDPDEQLRLLSSEVLPVFRYASSTASRSKISS